MSRWTALLAMGREPMGVNFVRQAVVCRLYAPTLLAAVREARLASAVAHEHARRLVAHEPSDAMMFAQDPARLEQAFCPHGERPEACWPCFVEDSEVRT